MASVEIALLGGFQVRAAGQAIEVPGRKERALLAYLALPPGEPRSRDKLAGLLWSERGDKQARDSLKQAVLKLRKSLDGVQPSPLHADRESVTLDGGAVAVDAAEFERLIGEGTPEAAARATALYRGDLLDGFDAHDPAFDEWLLLERQRLRDLAREALASLLDRHLAGGAHDQAGAVARRLLLLDPLREAAHRALMRIYAAQGQTALALKQYQLCRDVLQGELGVKPEAETERLYRSIQEKRTGARRPPDAAPAAQVNAEASPLPDPPPSAHDAAASTPSAKPSIAVLPFANLSGDPEQDYFADGIVEDIISGLTRLHWLFVIARDSSFTYKGKAIDVKQVGRELGVRYLLEGSVRRAGDRVRIASELIDTATGAHIWADHFDGVLSDIFDLQDRITASVVGAIEPKLRFAEIERARRKPTNSVDAYDLFLRAVALNNTRKKEDIKEALRLLHRATEIDPRYAAAYALAGWCYLRQKVQGFVSPDDPVLAEGIRMARLAAEYGRDDPEALWMAAVTMFFVAGNLEDALALIERSLALNPNSANGLMASGLVRAYLGDTDTALVHLQRSRELSPLDPIVYGTCLGFATAHFMAGRYEEAAAWSDRTLRATPTYYPPALHLKTACCGLLGRIEEARKWVERLLAVNPDASLTSVQQFYKGVIRKADGLEVLLDGLRKAGLPSEHAQSSTNWRKPAIAVLPFANLGADPEQQYFGDGIAEDIITELSRYRSLLVMARNSCFQFRGPSIDIAAVRSKLGVRYVVEGSVRRVGARLQLTARLIDALNESHVWAERYDRDAGDIFAVQDDITRAIAATLEGRVAASGAEQARRRPTRDWQAYDYFLQGRELGHRFDFVGSEPYFARAIELDPGFAQAHAWRTNALIAKYWDERRAELLDEALQSARTALSLDDADAWCHLTMGFALSHRGQLDLAGPHFERAIALNPTDVQVVILRAWWLARVGRTDEAVELLDAAMHRDPFPPQWLWECRAIALMQARRYEDAIHALGHATKFHVWDHAYLAACYARLNRAAEARAAAAEVLRMDPQFAVRRYGQLEQFKNPADLDHLLEGMRKAGLPE